jgi:hypothetical protein
MHISGSPRVNADVEIELSLATTDVDRLLTPLWLRRQERQIITHLEPAFDEFDALADARLTSALADGALHG